MAIKITWISKMNPIDNGWSINVNIADIVKVIIYKDLIIQKVV